jgi:hypothetical protein
MVSLPADGRVRLLLSKPPTSSVLTRTSLICWGLVGRGVNAKWCQWELSAVSGVATCWWCVANSLGTAWHVQPMHVQTALQCYQQALLRWNSIVCITLREAVLSGCPAAHPVFWVKPSGGWVLELTAGPHNCHELGFLLMVQGVKCCTAACICAIGCPHGACICDQPLSLSLSHTHTLLTLSDSVTMHACPPTATFFCCLLGTLPPLGRCNQWGACATLRCPLEGWEWFVPCLLVVGLLPCSLASKRVRVLLEQPLWQCMMGGRAGVALAAPPQDIRAGCVPKDWLLLCVPEYMHACLSLGHCMSGMCTDVFRESGLALLPCASTASESPKWLA